VTCCRDTGVASKDWHSALFFQFHHETFRSGALTILTYTHLKGTVSWSRAQVFFTVPGKTTERKKPFSGANGQEPVPMFFTFYEVQIFTTVFIRDDRLFISWARAIQFTLLYILCLRFVLILYSRLCLIFKSSFLFSISDKQLCE
jgi:hypothetical protein